MTDEFNPYSPPVSGLDDEQGKGGLWRKNRQLVMQEDATLPNRCYRCNAKESKVRLSMPVYWTHPWALWVLVVVIFIPVIGWVVFLTVLLALLFMRVRKNTRIEYALCQKHNRIRLGLFGFGVLMMTIGLAGLSGILNSSNIAHHWLANVTIGFFGFGIIFTVISQMLSRPTVKRYTDKRIWLTRFGKPFLDSLEIFPDQD